MTSSAHAWGHPATTISVPGTSGGGLYWDLMVDEGSTGPGDRHTYLLGELFAGAGGMALGAHK